MGILGLKGLGSSNWATDERPKNFREMILWRDPNGQTPLTALMSKMDSESTDDPEFAWYEEELNPVRIQAAAQLVTTGVALTIYTTGTANAFDVVAGDLLLVEEDPAAGSSFQYEIVEVASDPSASNAITLTRGAAATTANTGVIATNAWLLKIGSAFEEGASSPTASSRTPTKFYNYTQIFKTAYNITNTAKETRYRTGDAVKNDKKRRSFDHSAALEHAWLFGSRHETTGSASQPKRYTGGLFYHLYNAYNATSAETIKIWTTTAVTVENVLDALHTVFDYGYTGAGNERLILAGNGLLNYLNKIVFNNSNIEVQYEGTIKYFGMELAKWAIPQGTFYIKTHPLMNVNSRFKNGGFVINPSAIKYRPLRNRDTKPQDNIQLPGDDELKGQWLTEAGVEFHHLKTMKYIGIHV